MIRKKEDEEEKRAGVWKEEPKRGVWKEETNEKKGVWKEETNGARKVQWAGNVW